MHLRYLILIRKGKGQSIMFNDNLTSNFQVGARIKVIGVGGAGNNAVNRMVEDDVTGVEFYVANTDAHVLATSKAENKIILGAEATRGLGAGADPEVGKQAALESEAQIREALQGADMTFVACGLGGGTGTGAAPIIAKIAKEQGSLVVGIVTKPFTFEGQKRNIYAYNGLEEIKKYTDSIIVVSNDKLMEVIGRVPLRNAFLEADNILRQGVQTITDLISMPSLINLDFADVRNVMKDKEHALIGIGTASGENRAEEAANKAIRSPLLEGSIKGATEAIVNVTGGAEFTIADANDAVNIIKDAAGGQVNIVFGVTVNEDLNDEMIVTVIATGFDSKQQSVSEIETRQNSLDTNYVKQAEEIATSAMPTFSKTDIEPISVSDDDSTREYDNTEEMDDLPAFLRRNNNGVDENGLN